MDCIDAGNVLVHLFLQTKTHYVLTNRKLQYLLVIAQLSRMACGGTLFDDDLKNYKHGFGIEVIGNNFMSASDIVSGTAKDVPIVYDASDFVLPFTGKRIFEIGTMPTDEDRKLLIDVFLAFGAFREESLGQLLGSFKELKREPLFKIISKDKLRRFILSACKSKKYNGNLVLEFFREQQTNQKTKKTVPAGPVRRVLPLVAMPALEREDKKADKQPLPTVQELVHIEKEPVTVQEKSLPVEAAEAQGQVVADEAPTQDAPVVATEEARAEQKEVPIAAPKAEAAAPRLAAVTPMMSLLKDVTPVREVVAGKRYSVLVEAKEPGYDCWVSVYAVDLERELPVKRRKLNDTLFEFSFKGVNSKIVIKQIPL